MMDLDSMTDAIRKRDGLTERLIQALEHLPQAQAVSIVSAFIPLNEFEDVVKFQERE